MTALIVKRMGKLLFPYLQRDLRRQQLSKLMLILLTIVLSNISLVLWMFWMVSGRH